MALSPLLCIVAGALLAHTLYTRITLYLARQRFRKDHGCQPCPYVFNKDPVLGWDAFKFTVKHSKAHTMLEGRRDCFRRLNTNTFHSRIMTMPVIATSEPENIKAVLSLKFKDYSLGSRKTAAGPFLGDGIFTTDGERWASSRHMLRPNFARDQVADLVAFERHFKLMLQHIPTDRSTVDLQELFFKLTIDTATEFLFNHSTNSLRITGQIDDDDDENEDVRFSKAFTLAQLDVLSRLRWGVLSHFRVSRKGNEANRICHKYVDKWVDDAVRWRENRDTEKAASIDKEEERYVFINELAKQISDKKRIRDELMNILLAGRDTTASLLSNMFFEIAKRPDIWAKLREEVAPLNGRPPTYEELKSMKYVKWCLNESLRTHPVVPGNSRYAVRDTVLPLGGGPSGQQPLFVPAGTLVAYSPYVMHRRADLYGPDADTYRPERWETLRPGWEYLPFNGGPRICLGQQYALTEAGYVTVRLVQQFATCESRDENGGVWVEGLTLTCCSFNGTKVSLTPA